MNEFHNDAHKKPFAILFHSHNIEQKFKERAPDYHCVVIRDKEENRLNAMLTSAGDIGAKFIQLQTSAVSAIAVASSPDEQVLMSLGLLKIIPGGLAICPTCLANAILTCQENLEVLKDIQEATNKYAVE